MNVHHLELFYYVAKHRGVSAAARHIPYGIQQPAISAQLIQLEDSLGVTLFHRRPFDLTPAGTELYGFIEPFFGGLPEMGKKLRGGKEVSVRIGAPGTIQMNYLPRILHALQKRIPTLVFTLSTGRQQDFEISLLQQKLDIAFCAVDSAPPPGIKHHELLRLPLGLMVREKSWIKSADQLWKLDRIQEPLITVPAAEPLCVIFQQELQRRKREWFPHLELDTFELVIHYVTQGFGSGLVVMRSDTSPPPGMRFVPLPDFPPLIYAAMWLGNLTPLMEFLVKEAEQSAKSVP